MQNNNTFNRSEGTLDKQLGLTLSFFRPDYIVEVGTFDGEGIKKFGNYSPRSGLVAFEANPNNFFDYCIGKPVHNLLISDTVGLKEIYEPADRLNVKSHSLARNRRVTSMNKVVGGVDFTTYTVLSTTLDTFFDVPISQGCTFALIMDVEGAAWEVLSGAKKFLENTLIIKAELEVSECFHDQKLLPDVEQLLTDKFDVIGATPLVGHRKQISKCYARHNTDVHRYFRSVGAEV